MFVLDTRILGAAPLRLMELSRAGPMTAAAAACALLFAAAWYAHRHPAVVASIVHLRALRPRHRRRPRAVAPAELPPAILVDGEANALSVARDLSRLGVRVYAIGNRDSPVRLSRHVRWLEVPPSSLDAGTRWAEYLLGPQTEHLAGAVLLACGDTGLEMLAHRRAELAARYRLDLAVPEAQLRLLDKLSTYELARAAGVPTPLWWSVRDVDDIEAIRDELVYPLLVKPRLSHLFDLRFGRKFIIAHDYESAVQALDVTAEAGMQVLLMELVPGGDDALCSYFTYIDEEGTPLFHYTKRVIRRYPVGMGAACYHITDWIPELIAPANRLLDEAGMRGLANVEFKLDPRDGQYKLIECNARFVASNALVSASGYPLAEFVYNRIVGRPLPKLGRYRLGMRQWDPLRDFLAFRQLRRAGQLTLAGWLRSVCHRQTFAWFRWTDPLPGLARLGRPLGKAIKRHKQ